MSDKQVGAIAKKTWTSQERLELAAKLDEELDAFFNSLEKKPYEEGWPEDRWQEEMEKHPFFMKKAPQPGEEVHPMFEGLQKLKYDPEENTCEELALNYKEDGNFYMKHKKFRMAIYSYTEGIKAKCENAEVLAILYNNRSAAHYFLKNYKSALADALSAIKYNDDYIKARWRAAQCAYELEKFDVCTQLCKELLDLDISNKEAQELLKKNKIRNFEAKRNQRKEAVVAKKRSARFQKLYAAIKQRAIKFDELKSYQKITEELLRPKFLPLQDHPVHLDEEDGTSLIWPSAFLYPEFLFTDFQQISEHATMNNCLATLLTEPLLCDKANSYRIGNLNVYYENRKLGRVHKIVNLEKTIKDITQEKDFFVTGGTLMFYIVPKDSSVEQEFIHQQRRPMVHN